MIFDDLPLYDRTQDDVDRVKEMIAYFKSHHIVKPTDWDKELWKGCLNYQDMNRIEGNIKIVSDLLVEGGYKDCEVNCKTDWTKDDLIDIINVERVLTNLTTISDNWYDPSYVELGGVPTTIIDFNDVNAVEEFTYWLGYWVELMRKEYLISGTFYSGERRLLPLGRK